MSIASRFNCYLAIYILCNAAYMVPLAVADKIILGFDLLTVFFFFVLAGPVTNTVISLILKLKNKAYTWHSFIGTFIAMLLAFLINTAIMFVVTAVV